MKRIGLVALVFIASIFSAPAYVAFIEPMPDCYPCTDPDPEPDPGPPVILPDCQGTGSCVD